MIIRSAVIYVFIIARSMNICECMSFNIYMYIFYLVFYFMTLTLFACMHQIRDGCLLLFSYAYDFIMMLFILCYLNAIWNKAFFVYVLHMPKCYLREIKLLLLLLLLILLLLLYNHPMRSVYKRMSNLCIRSVANAVNQQPTNIF